MPTAVIYARFSCSKQREASIDDQLRVCHEWCAREGYEVVSQYCDHAVSGRTDDRPEFQRMLSNAGESDIVLPACAGMIPAAWSPDAPARSAPRMRGDDPLSHPRYSVRTACSPHARG